MLAVHRSPNKLWRSNSIFNLCIEARKNYIFNFFLKEGIKLNAHTKSNYMIFKTLKKRHLMTQSL
jgi:hypothetical protein